MTDTKKIAYFKNFADTLTDKMGILMNNTDAACVTASPKTCKVLLKTRYDEIKAVQTFLSGSDIVKVASEHKISWWESWCNYFTGKKGIYFNEDFVTKVGSFQGIGEKLVADYNNKQPNVFKRAIDYVIGSGENNKSIDCTEGQLICGPEAADYINLGMEIAGVVRFAISAALPEEGGDL